jgi:hypothetical protein
MHRTDRGSDQRTNQKLRREIARARGNPRFCFECYDTEACASAEMCAGFNPGFPRMDATIENIPMAGEDEAWKLRECRLEQEPAFKCSVCFSPLEEGDLCEGCFNGLLWREDLRQKGIPFPNPISPRDLRVVALLGVLSALVVIGFLHWVLKWM